MNSILIELETTFADPEQCCESPCFELMQNHSRHFSFLSILVFVDPYSEEHQMIEGLSIDYWTHYY